jgi:hypothetical protein
MANARVVVKDGYKSSEFYVALFAGVLPIVRQYVLPDLPVEESVAAVTALVTYIVGRTVVKIKNAK